MTTTNPYLDLLQVSHPRLTQNGRGRRRRQAAARPLLLHVVQVFDTLQAERLSLATVLAHLDELYPRWYGRMNEHHVRGQEVRAAVLARKLALHGVPTHLDRATKTRKVWRSDLDRAVRRAYSERVR